MDTVGSGDRPRTAYTQLWRGGGLTFVELIVDVYRGYRRHQLNARAAQFAYFALLAIAPLLIVILAFVSQFPWSDVLEEFLTAAEMGMPESTLQLIQAQIVDIHEHSTWELIGVGTLLLAMAGTRLFWTMGAALDASFGGQRRRRWWKSWGVSLLVSFIVVVLMLVGMVLLVWGPRIGDFVLSQIELPWLRVLTSQGVRLSVVAAFLLASTSVVYWLIPSVDVPWYVVSPGSAFATAGWFGVTQAFRIYVEEIGNYNETYGTLGGVVALLIWLHLTGLLLLLGGQINGTIYQGRSILSKRTD